MKGLRCNSLSCSSSISEVTTRPKQQHKDARWIRGILSSSPSLHLFQSQHALCTGIQKADDRRPNHTGSFSLSLFSFLKVIYSDVSFFPPRARRTDFLLHIVTCLSSRWKSMTKDSGLGRFHSFLLDCFFFFFVQFMKNRKCLMLFCQSHISAHMRIEAQSSRYLCLSRKNASSWVFNLKLQV